MEHANHNNGACYIFIDTPLNKYLKGFNFWRVFYVLKEVFSARQGCKILLTILLQKSTNFTILFEFRIAVFYVNIC